MLCARICRSKGQTPTLSDSLTTNGTGSGSLVSNITGLTANTQLQWRYSIMGNGELINYLATATKLK